MAEKTFKIVELKAENFKKLTAVAIRPDKATVLVTGKNGAGKSCVLDCIMAALCGKKACPDKPIRNGAENARIEVDMGEFTVVRTFTASGGGTLNITSKEGFKANSPQKLLDTIVGDIAFDPTDFIRMGATAAGKRQQREILMKMAGLDFSDIDTAIEDLKAKRSVAAKEKERLTALATPLTEGLPEAEISLTDLMGALENANRHNALAAEHKRAVESITADLTRSEEHVATMDTQLERLRQQVIELEQLREKELTRQKTMTAEQLKRVSNPPLPVDTEQIRRDMASAEETNRAIRANAEKKRANAAAANAAAEVKAIGQKIVQLEQQKQDRLVQAVFPVPGLSVDGDGVLYDGLPLSQINDAKKLEIAVAVSMKLNPKLRVLRMDGNGLDSASLAVIEKMVADSDYQAWIEKVDETGKVGIVIEDGQIAAPAPAPVQKDSFFDA